MVADASRIGAIDVDDPDQFMASDNVFDYASEHGYWDPKSGAPLKWDDEYGARVGIVPRMGTDADIRWFDVDPVFG